MKANDKLFLKTSGFYLMQISI